MNQASRLPASSFRWLPDLEAGAQLLRPLSRSAANRHTQQRLATRRRHVATVQSRHL
jgi:hypothetical protein